MYQEEDHLKMISNQINLRSVEITVTKGLVQDNTGQILSFSCISQGECVIQGYPYIFDIKIKYSYNLTRIQTEVVLVEGTCTAVLLQVREFEVRNETCYADSLPVYLKNKPMYLTGKHDLVVKNRGVNQIDCNKKFLPMHIDINNKYLFQASPV